MAIQSRTESSLRGQSHQDFAEGARLRQVPASESKHVNKPKKFNLVIKVFIFHFNLRKEGRKERRERGKEGRKERWKRRDGGRKEGKRQLDLVMN